jgi:YVTN family beta-propeller protein
VGLEISLAGRVSIRSNGVLIDEARFPGRQGRLVFAYLVSEHGHPVLRDDLAEALWGETPPATWEKALGGIASKLRALLGECGLDGAKALTSAFGCCRLELPEGTWVDLTAAAQGADAAEAALAAGDLNKAKTEARQAAALARLPLLPGEGGSWVENERRALGDLLVRALECLAEACLRSGGPAEAAKWAGEVTVLEPFRESSYRRLMQAHAAAGNRAEGLRTYERCRRLLAEELGAYPSPETEAIYRDLLRSPPTEAPPTAVDAGAPPPKEVPKRSWPPSRRTIALAAIAVAIIAAGLGLLLGLRGGSSAIEALGPNELAVLDPDGGSIASHVEAGAAPGAVTVGADAVWVSNPSDNSVSRIDASTDAVRQTIPVGNGPAGIAPGRGAVWVANGLEGTVSRIDPTTNRVVQTITVGNGPSGVAYGEKAIWVTNSADGTVSQIDPDTGTVRRTLPAVIGASGVAVGFHRVWITSPPSGSVVALDARSGEVLQQIGVGVDPDAVAVGAGAVWVANRADGTVSKFDPGTGAVADTIAVGQGPTDIAAGTEDVWVANGSGKSVSRIDASRGASVQTVRFENPPQGVAVSPTATYVAVGSTGSEHRGGMMRALSMFPVTSIDPAVAGPFLWPILILTNDGLVAFRRVAGVQGAQLVPDLAVSLPTPTDGGRTYTFQLRRGIRYSSGKPVQPDDFKRAIERLWVSGPLGFGQGEAVDWYTGILGADRCALAKPCDLSRGIVTNRIARTVTFHLRAPDADFPARLALPPAFAVPAGTPAHAVGGHIAATGPYRIAESGRRTKTLRLVRNPRFREWSADAQPDGYPDAISWSWRFNLDPSAQVRAVERGLADVALGGSPPLPRRQLDVLAVRRPEQLHVSTGLSTTFFFLNTRAPPFDDARARRAVNNAFDREAFARQLGAAFSPTCQILPPNFPGYRPTCPYASGGVRAMDSARRLVRKSGTAGARVLVWMPGPIAGQGGYLVSLLDSLGYRARLKRVKPERYFEAVSDSRLRPQAGYYSWNAGFPSATDFIPPQFSCATFKPGTPGQSNMSEFCDRAIDAEMARAAAVQVRDPAAATVLWQRVEKSLLARGPVVPAYNRRIVDFVSRRVGSYQYNPQWGFLLDQAWVK